VGDVDRIAELEQVDRRPESDRLRRARHCGERRERLEPRLRQHAVTSPDAVEAERFGSPGEPDHLRLNASGLLERVIGRQYDAAGRQHESV